MLKHIDSVHEGNKPFKCESCERTFAHKGNMKKHILQGISYQLEHIKFKGFTKFQIKVHAGFFRLLIKGIFDPYVL